MNLDQLIQLLTEIREESWDKGRTPVKFLITRFEDLDNEYEEIDEVYLHARDEYVIIESKETMKLIDQLRWLT